MNRRDAEERRENTESWGKEKRQDLTAKSPRTPSSRRRGFDHRGAEDTPNPRPRRYVRRLTPPSARSNRGREQSIYRRYLELL